MKRLLRTLQGSLYGVLDFLAFFFPVLVLLILLLVGVGGGHYYLSKNECRVKADEMGLAYSFTFYGGCMVGEEGSRLPLSTHLARTVEQNMSVKMK